MGTKDSHVDRKCHFPRFYFFLDDEEIGPNARDYNILLGQGGNWRKDPI